MSYRKIEVDGIGYEYTVGRTHVKVKGLGVALTEDVGRKVDVVNYCDCHPSCDVVESETKKIAVQPADVARWIRSMVSA